MGYNSSKGGACMKTSTAIIIAGFLVFLGITIYSLSNIFYIDSSTGLIVNKMTGEVKEPKTQETEIDWGEIFPWARDEETNEAENNTTLHIDKGDFSKVTISGHSIDTSNPYYRVITCTVTNNDTIKHLLTVKAVFYDKNSVPILTEESFMISVAPGGIESVTLTTFDNVENLYSYELMLVQSESDGVIRWSDE